MMCLDECKNLRPTEHFKSRHRQRASSVSMDKLVEQVRNAFFGGICRPKPNDVNRYICTVKIEVGSGHYKVLDIVVEKTCECLCLITIAEWRRI